MCASVFLGDYFWNISVFSAIWVDSGYMTVSVYEVGFDGDSARVVVEVSLLMVLMILFGTARVRLLKIQF